MRNALLATFLLGAGAPVLLAAEALPQPAALPALLDGRALALSQLDELYDRAVQREGKADSLIAQLVAYADDGTRSEHFRAQALLAVSHLQWRSGDLSAASGSVERGLALLPDSALWAQRGRLFDAQGELDKAAEFYSKALAGLKDPAQREELQLRLALLATGPGKVDALVSFAKERDRAFRNRAAVVLALLGHPKEALGLYEVFGDESQRRRQSLRRADWALQARLAAPAQEAAWSALEGAPHTRDLRYALALLLEAHELDGSWERLLARLASRNDSGAETTQVRVEVLRRLGRFDEAIALLSQVGSQNVSPESQRLLLRMYAEAGRGEEMAARFRKLMARQPEALAWPRGLGEYYLERGERERALEVWRQYLAPLSSGPALLGAADEIAAQGLDALAFEACQRCLRDHPESSQAANALLFELYLKRGRSEEALGLLEKLDAGLSAFAPERVGLAADFERLQLPARAAKVWEGLAKKPGGLTLEEKMRLAWLYDATGRRDDSYALWKSLWTDDLPEARLRLVEDRLLSMGAELGRLGDLAVELEEKLAAGKASPRERSLLIRIYSSVDDPASAVEVIQEYFGGKGADTRSQIASLEEQAKVFRALNRPQAFERVAAQLLRLDPSNAVDHLQALVINQLDLGRIPDLAKLEARLAELRALDPEASDAFAAGVFQMAGQRERALELYRRALAAHPAQNDYRLLLADLMASAGKSAQAVAMLQYSAEFAGGDEAFVTAVDGLLNRKLSPFSPTLGWARRRVLERVALEDDKYPLYELSAELGEETRDVSAYLLSLENSLAEAGPRRSNILRELITATAAKPASLNALNSADDARNLRYSRRLVALGEEMPPGIYLELGRGLLRQRRVAEALDVFQTAFERIDQAGLREEAGDRFLDAGYKTEAASLYQKALIVEGDNSGLSLKLARLRYDARQGSQAAKLSLDALLRLIARQLVFVEAVPKPPAAFTEEPEESVFSFDFRRDADGLRGEFLLSLPDEERDAALACLEAAFDEALASARTFLAQGKPERLENYPRLRALAVQGRYVALQSSAFAVADRLDGKLLAAFAQDDALVADIVTSRLAFGRASSARRLTSLPGVASRHAAYLSRAGLTTETFSDLGAAVRRALDEGRYAQAVRLAGATGDEQQAVRVYQAWMTGEVAVSATYGGYEAAAARPTAVSVSQKPAVAAFDSASRVLSQAAFSGLCSKVFAKPDSAALAQDLLFGGVPGLLAKVETGAGRPLLSKEKLSSLISEASPEKLAALDAEYVRQHYPECPWPELYLRYSSLRSGRSLVGPKLLEFAFAGSVSAEQGDRIVKSFEERYSRLSVDDVQNVVRMDNGFYRAAFARVSPENAALAERLKAVIGRWTRVDDSLPREETLAGARGTAKAVQLTDLLDAVPAEAAELDDAFSGLFRLLPSAASRSGIPGLIVSVQERLAKEPAKPALWVVWAALQRLGDPQALPAQRTAVARFAEKVGADPLSLEAYAALCRNVGLASLERETLERRLVLVPEDADARRRLASLWKDNDNPVKALETLAVLRPSLAAGALAEPSPAAPNRPFSAETLAAPDALRTVVQALVAGLPAQPGDVSGSTLAAALRSVSGSLRAFRLSLDATSAKQDPLAEFFPAPRFSWERTPFALDVFVEAVRGRDYYAEETRGLLRLLHPATLDRENLFAFYEGLGVWLSAHGQLDSETARLETELKEGRAGAKELLLWLELAGRQSGPRAAESYRLAPGFMAAAGGLPECSRVLLARLAAKNGDRDTAARIYFLLLAKLGEDRRAFSRANESEIPQLLSLQGVLGDAERHLDSQGLEALVRQVSRFFFDRSGSQADPFDAAPAQRLWLSAFAARNGLSPDAAPAVAASDAATLAERAGLVLTKARNGAQDEALELLRALLVPSEASARSERARYQESSRTPPLHLLFPSEKAGWAGAESWAALAVSSAAGWLEAGRISADEGLRLLAVAAVRQKGYGAPEAAETAKTLLRLAEKQPSLDGATSSLLVFAAAETKTVLSPVLLERLTRNADLSVSLYGPLLEQLVSVRGKEAAFAFGEGKLALTLNDRFLETLERLATDTGRTGRTQEIRELRERARRAREDLANRDS